MLPRTARLTRGDFSHYFAVGTRSHSPFATVIVAPSQVPHGAVVVSKKVAKLAVERNLLRRRVYHLVAAALAAQPAVCIVLLKPAARTVSRAELRAALSAHIGRALKSL
jgi:ribonuclease P protein component